METATETARRLLHEADNVLILAGAGMSQELGTQTYWTGQENKYAGATSQYGFTDLEHAHAEMWETHKIVQKDYYNANLQNIIGTDVNATQSPYRILKEYLDSTAKNYFVMTTNVDGAFVRSGYSNDSVYEVHGSRLRSQCLDHPLDHGIFPTDISSSSPTSCPKCQGDTRPNCLFFVDFAFNPSVTLSQQDRFTEYRESLQPASSILLEIGAGTTIATIRNQALRVNSKLNIPVVRINPDDIDSDGGLKNILRKSVSAPFLRIKENAGSGLNSLVR